MRITATNAPTKPADLLIRMHNLVGAAVDITGLAFGESRWTCHRCGEHSGFAATACLDGTRQAANAHASECRAAFHHLT